MGALDTQVGGDHYKKFKIQPIEFITANNIPFIEGNIIKYVCRHAFKDKAKDLEKVKHYADLCLELNYGKEDKPIGEVFTEVSAVKLAAAVLNNKYYELIMRNIIYHAIVKNPLNFSDLVNSSVLNHFMVDFDSEETCILSIKLKKEYVRP